MIPFTAWMQRLLTGIVLAAMLGPWVSQGTAIAQATPTPDAPKPERCTSTAPSYDAIGQIMMTPSPAASPVASPVAASNPASAADGLTVTTMVQTLIACFNAGEPLRAYGLYSDRYLRHLLSVQGYPTKKQFDALATPEPLRPDRYVRILGIREIQRTVGGGLRATVTLRYAGIPVPKTFAVVLVETATGWRIDGFLGEINFSLP